MRKGFSIRMYQSSQRARVKGDIDAEILKHKRRVHVNKEFFDIYAKTLRTAAWDLARRRLQVDQTHKGDREREGAC